MIKTLNDVLVWLREDKYENLIFLFKEADRCRKEFVGDKVHLRGLIEFSNYCMRNCLYCGLRRENTKLKRYRMEIKEIFKQAKLIQKLGFKTVVLQSGEDPYYRIKDLCRLIEKIKKKLNLAVALCIGERSFRDYKDLKEAGADRYLLKFETSDYKLYKKLKPDSSYKNRFRCLEYLRRLDFQTGSGNIVGLPFQSLESLAQDIMLFKELDLDMIGIGPFIPHPNTPLREFSSPKLELVLKVIALTRLITKITHIPATTAMGTLYNRGREKALECGANVIMPNVTPQKYKKYYQIYPNKVCVKENPKEFKIYIEKFLASIGRKIATDFGHSLRKNLVFF